MEFVKDPGFSQSCESQHYDPTCLASYNGSIAQGIFAYYEQSSCTFFYSQDYTRTIAEYFAIEEIWEAFGTKPDGGHAFLTAEDGSYVLSYDNTPFKAYEGKQLSEVLLEDIDESTAFNEKVVGSFEDYLVETEFDGDLYSIAPIKVAYGSANQTILQVGVLRSAEHCMYKYNALIEDVETYVWALISFIVAAMLVGAVFFIAVYRLVSGLVLDGLDCTHVEFVYRHSKDKKAEFNFEVNSWNAARIEYLRSKDDETSESTDFEPLCR